MATDGKIVWFEKDIVQNFEALQYPAPFKEFAKIAVREELARRMPKKEVNSDANPPTN